MIKKTIIALSVSGALIALNVSAANKVADARGNAMANTGVASADYLTAPFYNPALSASFDDNDDFGFLFAAGASANDKDDTATTIDDLQSAIDNNEISKANNYLEDLGDNDALTVNLGASLAIAIPTKLISTSLFARGYTELVVDTSDADTGDYNTADVDLLAFGYAEVGLALAKDYTVLNEDFSLGISPKYQKMTTYAQRVSVEDFDIEDYDKSKVTDSALNFDLGAAWYKDDFQIGVAVKDLFEQEIAVEDTSNNLSDSYKLDTQVTVAAAYNSEFFTAAIDVDLTKQTRFQDQDDDTQFVRLGLEGNAGGWAQLRAGYEVDLQNTLNDAVTAGIGISPFDVISVDISGSYAGENQIGLSAGMAVTF